MNSTAQGGATGLPDFTGNLVSHSPIGMIITDAAGVVEQINPKAVALCGASSAAELLGKPLHPSAADTPDQPINLLKALQGVQPENEHHLQQPAHVAQSSRDCTFIPLQHKDGTLKGMLVLMVDIREKMFVEDSLFHAKKMTALDTLVGGVAHELNNPLTAILGYSEYLLSHKPDEAAQKHLSFICEEAQRCQQIIENLLAFVQEQHGQKEVLNLNDLLEEIVALCTYQLHVARIELCMELDPQLPRCEVDRRQFQKVLLNLLSNALNALGSMEERKRSLTIRSERAEKGLRILLADNGPGMPEEVASRVFDPFFTNRAFGEGIGLGLSVAYGIIQDHQGDITVSSEEGKGTTFVIELPAKQAVKDGD
jgi:two-component system, NtrC family, sensor kinase